MSHEVFFRSFTPFVLNQKEDMQADEKSPLDPFDHYPIFETIEEGSEKEMFAHQITKIEHSRANTVALYWGFDKIRERVNAVLNSNELFSVKMAELGTILFFLDRGESFFPQDVNALDRLLDEIKSNIDKYDKVLDYKTSYLLPMFANVLITSTGEVNMGAIYAIFRFLDESTFSLLFEHDRTQIREVLTQLLKNKAFFSLLEETVEVHPNAAPFVTQALSNFQNVFGSFSQEAVKRAIVRLVFFTDLRQEGPNCYAIASLIYAIHYSPYKILVNLKKILALGGMKLETRAILTLPILMQNKGFHCQGTNILHQILIAIVEFIEINQNERHKLQSANEVQPCKAGFLAFLRQQLFANLKQNLNEFSKEKYNEFFDVFQGMFENSIWLGDKNDSTVVSSTSNSQNSKDLEKLAHHHREVMLITKKEQLSIRTIKEFKDVLWRMFATVAISFEDEFKGSLKGIQFVRYIEAYVQSERIDDMVAKFLKTVNEAHVPSLTESDYRTLDKFYAISDGGFIKNPIEYFDIDCVAEFITAQDPHLPSQVSMIFTVCKWLHGLGKKQEIITRKALFLCASLNHAFLLTPSRFCHLWAHDPKKMREELMELPGKRVLEKPLSLEKIKRILQLVELNEILQAELIESYQIKPASLLKKQLCILLAPPFHEKLKETFNQVCESVSFLEIMEEGRIMKILKNLTLDSIDEDTLQKVEKSFKKNLHQNFKSEEYSLFALSYYLKLALVQNKINQADTFDIEPFIALEFDLPCTFEIGDLNYINEDKHSILVLKWDIFNQNFALVQRNGTKQRQMGPNLLNGLTDLRVYYPTNLEPKAESSKFGQQNIVRFLTNPQ